MQKSFRTRVIVFYEQKKILKWNIAGSRDANPHIEVLSAPTSPVEQTSMKSAIGRNPLRGSKCKSKTSSFWFFYLPFFIIVDSWVISVISDVMVGLPLHAFLFFPTLPGVFLELFLSDAIYLSVFLELFWTPKLHESKIYTQQEKLKLIITWNYLCLICCKNLKSIYTNRTIKSLSLFF